MRQESSCEKLHYVKISHLMVVFTMTHSSDTMTHSSDTMTHSSDTMTHSTVFLIRSYGTPNGAGGCFLAQ